MTLLSRRRLLGALVLATTATAWANGPAFDFSPQQASRPRAPKNPEAVAAIGKDFRFVKDGVLTVAIHPGAAPLATYATDTRSVVGADPDIAQLVADALGLRLELLPIAWADWPLGLSSGKYDAVISNVGVTEERKLRFDFSTYRQGLHGFFVRSDSPIKAIQAPKDIAGLRVITGSGTIQERILLEWNKQNQVAGLKPAELLYFDDDGARQLALSAGRADANFNPHGPQAYHAAKDGRTRLVGLVNAGWPLKADVAITTRKGSGLAAALTVAINGLIRSGHYGQALARWGLADEAVARSETNPPGLPKF